MEAHADRRVERALDAISVQLPGSYVWHEDVPVVIRAVDGWIEAHHACGFRVLDSIEQQQLHAGPERHADSQDLQIAA